MSSTYQASASRIRTAWIALPRSQGSGGRNPRVALIRRVAAMGSEEPSLTISEAKRLLGISLGVDPSQIKITIEA